MSDKNKNGWFNVSSGIFDPKHVEKIGGAVWLFLYLVHRETRENDGQGVVNYGYPVSDPEIARCGLNIRTIIRHRKILVEGGYITATRAPRGYIYTVHNAKKFKPGSKYNPVDDGLGEGLTDEEQQQLLQEFKQLKAGGA